MMTWLISRLRTTMAIALVLVTAGCQSTPATSQQRFTPFMSPTQEAQIGREQHPKIVQEFGGEYPDARVRQYVTQIGQRLVRGSEAASQPFTFTVLNNDVVNAFALPGGYVYVTRGLLALASSEAELAGVLGHEIGHVTARHTAQRYSTSVAANLGIALLGVLTGSDLVAQVSQGVAGIALAGYSRDQEFESDELGIRYLGAAGYDTNAMASFLAKLQQDSRLSAQIMGRPGAADGFDIMQTHPRTADRVREAIDDARRQGKVAATPRIGRDEYFGAIDGLWYGGDPEHGFVRGNVFIHPALRLQFEAPQGFRIFNDANAVTARTDGAQIVFDRDASNAAAGPLAAYIQGVWAKGVQISRIEPLSINGLEAASATSRVDSKNGPVDVRLLAIRYDPRTIYRFMFSSQPNLTSQLTPVFRRTAMSFRPLSAAEAAAARPQRIRVVTVGAGDTVQSLSRRMATPDFDLERFLVMNGLAPGQALLPGDKVKIVAE